MGLSKDSCAVRITVYGLRLLRGLTENMSPGSVDVPDVLCVHKEVLDGLDPEVELLVLLDPRRVVAGGSAHVPEAEQRQVCF